MKILNIDPYDEDERTGYLRYVQVQYVFILNEAKLIIWSKWYVDLLIKWLFVDGCHYVQHISPCF